MKARSPKSEWPLEIKSGSVVVKIYRTQKSGGYTSYCAVFYKGHERKVRFFKNLDLAKSTAKAVADEIAQGEHVSLELTGLKRLQFLRAMEILEPLNIPIDVAIGRYAEAHQQLAAIGVDVVEAARQFARQHVGVTQKSVAAAVTELVEQIETEQKNTTNGTRRKDAWLKLLRSHLQRKLADDFNCNVSELSSHALEPWLVGLKLAERTRRNIRDCVAYFIKWAKGRQYLAKDADPLGHVQNFRKRKLGLVEVISADELATLLAHAPEDFVVYLALRAFAGLRDCEARALQWEHVDLKAKWIDIPEHVAKQSDDDEGVRRMVKIRPVLAAWLRPRAQKAGPVCPYKNTVKKLLEVVTDAGIEMPRNALRHSFISAAVTLTKDLNAVAMEAGNSVPVIRQHYWRKMRPEQARKWFAVTPEKVAGNKCAANNIVPLETAPRVIAA